VRQHALVIALGAALCAPFGARAYEIGFPYYDSIVAMYVNMVGTSPSGVRWNAAFADAAARWNGDWDVRIDVFNQYSDPCAGVAPLTVNDSRNGVAFRDDLCGFAFDEDTLAVTLRTFQLNADPTIVEADIVFNDNVSWDVYDGPLRPGPPDFRRVATHELGHVIGLEHEDDVPALMNSAISGIYMPNADDRNGVSALYGELAAGDGNIELVIEEPVNGSTVSGVGNIRGWALGDSSIVSVELYIDGRYIADIPYGGTRNDVRDAYPARTESGESGYSMAFAWGLLAPGPHKIRIRALDDLDRAAEAGGTFTVASFDNAFISEPEKVSVDGTVEKLDARTIRLNRVQADGVLYDVKLQWQPASQKFEIVEIKPAG
jgi:hypothetical protein